jgi:hypothetical protein
MKNVTTNVVASIVVKAPRAASVVISPFHVKMYNAAFKAADGVCKAIESQRVVMANLLRAQYGDVAPTYAQFRGDRDALRVMALDRGLVDDQWVRKPYNAAVLALYGALPVSDSPAALAKRAQRPVVVKGKAKPGAVKGDTAQRVAPADSTPEGIAQFIAKVGAGKVLAELSKILATKKDTQLDASALQAIAKKYA